MKITFFPKTKLGIWSVCLFAFVVLVIVYFYIMVNVYDQRGGETFFSNLLLTIPMLLAWVAGVASCVVGLVAIVKHKSRAILLYIVVLLTLFVTLYGLMEVAFPH